MEVSEYFTIVVITVSIVMGALVLFFGIMLRSKGPYRARCTAPLEQELQDGDFQWRNDDFHWWWMFVGLLICIALALLLTEQQTFSDRLLSG
jgi:hypothetical protein